MAVSAYNGQCGTANLPPHLSRRIHQVKRAAESLFIPHLNRETDANAFRYGLGQS